MANRNQSACVDALREKLRKLTAELERVQRELGDRDSELERVKQQRNQFIGMAAHDLRTPLTAIKFYSYFLLTQPVSSLTDEERKFVAVIHSSSDFMGRLVDDLLDLALIESGRLRLNLSPTDIVDLASRTITLLGVLAARKSVAIRFSADPVPAMILDAQKLEQVLNNLVGNALKFSPAGATVEVRVEGLGAEGVRLTVRDQGPGIPRAEIDRLFHPFERTTVRDLEGEKSSGLGLAIVRRVVEGHRGRIAVESEVGKGTEFVVELPVLSPEEAGD